MIPTIILAGGFGSRFIEETNSKPKPMITIGGKPILWHIMKHYASFGFHEFVIALGYKGEAIKDYFKTPFANADHKHLSALAPKRSFAESNDDNWSIKLVDTGVDSHTGRRIKKLAEHIGNRRFFLTYGDGLADVDLNGLLHFHLSHGKLATVTAINPVERFGLLTLDDDQVVAFSEKEKQNDKWVNGGFFLLEPEVLDYINDDLNEHWEQGPLQTLAHNMQLMAYKHTSFWQCMDTQHDKYILEDLWQSGNPPWKIW